MAYANFKIYKLTNSSLILTVLAIIGLLVGTLLIIYYEAITQIEQVYFIGGLYFILTFSAWLFSKFKNHN